MSAPPRIPIGQLPSLDTDALLEHTKMLSSDEFEGRAPGTKGEELTVTYLADQFKKFGLRPGNTDGTYFQTVPLVGITPTPAPLTFKKGANTHTLKWKDDVVAWTKHVADSASINESELVFVGYGVVAPEFNWDDYKGLDVKGKTLVMLVNDPPVSDPSNPAELDAKTFGGKAMTYYGRWTYKYEMAAQKGAAGALIIHETVPAGYGFNVIQGKVGEQFDLVTPDKNMSRVAVEGWVTLDQAKQLLKTAGQDFDALKQQAATRDFKPVPLGVNMSLTLRNDVQKKQTANVIGKLPGRDPILGKQAVLYTAHHDHLGMREATKPGEDVIYNGARDNASGVAAVLAIARAMKALPQAPRRTILFAAVAGEEQGLLGSGYLAAHPPAPIGLLAANINIDELGIWGKTRDMIMIGKGKSTLDTVVEAIAAAQGRRHIVGDQNPDKGFFYRSDQFNLAKRGVPAAYLESGVEVVGKPEGWGAAQHAKYEETDYHQPSDELRPDWDFSGAVEDAQFLFYLGVKVAEGKNMPSWNPGDEFEAARKKALAETP